MNEITKFRTALAGFHRGDVAAYIEQSAAAHREKIKALEAQIIKLQNENTNALRRLYEAETQLASANRDSRIMAQIRQLLTEETSEE